jgi:malate dehydrogenase
MRSVYDVDLLFVALVNLQAYACQWFTNRLMDAMSGAPNVIECAFVQSNLTPAPFFSSPVRPAPFG